MSLNDFVIMSKLGKLLNINNDLENLGEGSYSQVYKVKRNSDSKIYALKKVSMDSLTTRER
jgi:serine/threonine protein kinase